VAAVSTLLVTSTGGHLAELVRLAPRLPLDGPVTWVTFDTTQARLLLRGERVECLRYTKSRDVAGVVSNLPVARRLLSGDVRRVISNGAAIALSVIPQARARGIACHYIECSARTLGPSATGRLLSLVPGVRLYAQHQTWAGDRWGYGGSVYDLYEAGPTRAPDRPLRVAITVGTQPFPFTRLVSRLAQVLPEDSEIVACQTGTVPTSELGGLPGRPQVPGDELLRAFRRADVVISHSGVGSTFDALDAGRCPVLIPRRREFGEHIDNHQVEIAEELERRGLAVARDAAALTTEDILEAASRSVRLTEYPPDFQLS
jgi:UDP-N-acetylglucosamine transferase subunit ALG13